MLSLVEITQDNWQECVRLSVLPEQKSYVAPNTYSLAESKYEPERYPLGIFNGEKLIGFIMYGYDAGGKTAWIIRFMVDHKYQNKGFGKEALSLILKLLKEKYPNAKIRLCVEPENAIAIKFYQSFGFMPTGEKWEDELVFELQR